MDHRVLVERARAAFAAGLRATGLGASDRPLVAFSGGADSAALLVLLAEWPGSLGAEAVHVDHGLRPTSADEARRAAALAASLGFACRVVRVTPEGKGGPEARARRARYRALAGIAPGRPVLTAHTADDQAETILLRLARGTGGAGLAGVRPRARIEGVEVRRPLLGLRREELRAVLRSRGIEPVLDPSNADPSFARNRVRATVLPALEAALPGAVPALARAAALLAADEAYLDRRVDRALRRLVAPGGDVDAFGLLALPAALRGRAVRHLVAVAGGSAPSREDVERVLGTARRGGEVHLRRGILARCRGGRLSLEPGPTGRAGRPVLEPPLAQAASLAPGAPVAIGDVRVEVARGPAGSGTDPLRFELPADVAPPFLLRTVAPGERVPVPGVGSRKVRELLREAGVPVEARERAVLLVAGGAPAWLVGVRPLAARPAEGEPAWVFTTSARRRPGNEGGAPTVGADG